MTPLFDAPINTADTDFICTPVRAVAVALVAILRRPTKWYAAPELVTVVQGLPGVPTCGLTIYTQEWRFASTALTTSRKGHDFSALCNQQDISAYGLR